MGPVSTDDPRFWETVRDWLSETDDLLVDVYYPRSMSGGTQFLLRSMQDFERLVADARANAVTTVFQGKRYPIRGVVDEALITIVQGECNRQMPLSMVKAEHYPVELEFLAEGGSGNPVEFLHGLPLCLGHHVFVGLETELPADYSSPNTDPGYLIARK